MTNFAFLFVGEFRLEMSLHPDKVAEADVQPHSSCISPKSAAFARKTQSKYHKPRKRSRATVISITCGALTA